MCSTVKFVENASLHILFRRITLSGCTVDNKPLPLDIQEKNQETALILKVIVSWSPNYFHPQSEVNQDQQ